MAIGPRLDLRQTQQLVMTPQLQQAIKLLQLNNLELRAYVADEIERNPLLDVAEEEEREREAATRNEREVEADQALERDPASNAGEALDADLSENVFNHDSPSDAPAAGSGSEGLSLNGTSGLSRGGAADFDGAMDMENRLTEDASLRDHLLDQLHLVVHEATDRLIGAHLIDMVDDSGYLTEPLDDVPERLGCAPEDVERVLRILQGFEPTGVCARSLAECLKIQQSERDRLDPAMATLLDNLDLLGKQDLVALRRLCQVDQVDLLDMIGEIQALNPKPGLAFGGSTAETVIPDIFVKKAANGAWQVELNSAVLPRVLVNRRYFAQLSSRDCDDAEKSFISECMSSANWLVKALDQRARTILKVSSELVKQQEAFFEKGVRHLRPLNLRHVAEAIEMHESTVSRVTNNKYMATPRGIFELKYFFTTAIPSSGADGNAHSAEAVRARIRELIDEEDPSDVLSDDRLVEILRGEEVEIARRTVAKYRESMRIPSSVQRRRQKRLAG